MSAPSTHEAKIIRITTLENHPYRGYFDENLIKSLAEGKSTVKGTAHIREGCVIRPETERQVHNLGRLQLKIVSNQFLEKD